MFCKDILEQIFVHLSGRDLLSCSIVCKDWNKVSKDNVLWFRVLRRDLPQKIKKNPLLTIDPRFTYIDDLSYKSLYLCYFLHRYKCGAAQYYKELCAIPLQLTNWMEKIATFSFFMFGGIIFLPCIMMVEIYDFCQAKKYEFCDCDECYKRSIPLLKKYYRTL